VSQLRLLVSAFSPQTLEFVLRAAHVRCVAQEVGFRTRLSEDFIFSVNPHYNNAHIHSSPSEGWRINTLEDEVPKKSLSSPYE
jgi:hypothetical protein